MRSGGQVMGVLRAFVVFAIIIGGLSVGNVLFRIGMAEHTTLTVGQQRLAMAGGMILMIVQQACIWYAMKTMPASVVIPITCLNIAVVPLLEYWWLGEAMRLDRWLGIVLITIGVAVVARSQGAH
ncbi:MAG: EamA family transporter [Armatimonadetes bacterium]|nr:EamA family transporter [Armatimonadota bacterium]